MQIRRGTATAWATADPTLVAGELGFVTDVGKTAFKIGDGTNPWTTLPYVNSTYTEFPVDAGNNLDTAIVQGRYPLLSGVAYTNVPPLADFNGTTTDGSSLLLVTVPSSTIVIQELTTSLTPCKRFIRARATTSAWTAWKRLDTLSATESLSITDLTLSGNLTVGTTSGVLTIPAGVVGTPSLTFSGDTNTGVYSTGADNVSITTGGVQRLSIGSGTPTINATGSMTVSSTLTASNALTVSGGATTLLATSINGNCSVTSATTTNQLSVGSVTSALTQTVIKQHTYPAVGIFGRNTSDPSGLLFGTYNYLGNAVTTIRSDGVPTAGTDLATKSYVDSAGAVYNGTLAAIQNFVLSNSSPPSYTLSIASNSIGVEHWYKVTSTSNPSSGSPRFADIFITVPSGVSAIFTVESNYGVGAGLGITFSPVSTQGRVITTGTVATVRLSNSDGVSSGVAGIAAGWFSVKKIVTI